MLSTTVNGDSSLTEKHWLDDTCISITAAATNVLIEVTRRCGDDVIVVLCNKDETSLAVQL